MECLKDEDFFHFCVAKIDNNWEILKEFLFNLKSFFPCRLSIVVGILWRSHFEWLVYTNDMTFNFSYLHSTFIFTNSNSISHANEWMRRKATREASIFIFTSVTQEEFGGGSNEKLLNPNKNHVNNFIH
jgi:hypothetical protein